MKHPIHEGLKTVTELQTQGIDLLLLAIFHLDPFVFEFIGTELIFYTNIAKGRCQVKRILSQTDGNKVTTDRKK